MRITTAKANLKDRTMIHLDDEQMIPLQDSELDAVSGGTAVEYVPMLALIIAVCIDTPRQHR